jgi:aubergine-like protein
MKKKDGGVIHLVPELCVLTGQSDDMRSNFALQKDLNSIIKPKPSQRLQESKRLLEKIKENPLTKDLLKNWALSIEIDPIKIDAAKLDAGDLMMGKNSRISLEQTQDLDRRIQNEMLEQPPIKKLGIFCHKQDEEHCRNFIDTLKKSVDTFGYPMDRPGEFYVEGRDFSAWERMFQKNLDASVGAVILLLPGKKKSAPFYDQCK